MVTVREGKTFKTEKQVTKGPICCVSTTTKGRLQIDDENRFISIFTDDSPEQTKRILEESSKTAPEIDDDQLADWHGLQAVLAERAKLPFEFEHWRAHLAENVWNKDVRIRRYFPAFEGLARSVCLLRSFRFSDQHLHDAGKHRVTFVDFAVANLISNTAFSQSLSSPTEDDSELQRALLRISDRQDGAGVNAVDLAKELGISEHRAYRRLKRAHEARNIERANKSERGNRKLYLPAAPVQMLPDPQTIFRLLDLKEVSFRHPITGQLVRYRK